MPYPTLESLPEAIKKLPKHAQEIWQAAFNASWEEYHDEERCAKIAWAAVKKQYHKVDDEWVRNAAFSFDYQAALEIYDPAKHLAKILVIDTTINANKWQVSDEGLERALKSLIGKPLIAYPDHSGQVSIGNFIDAQKLDGIAVGIAEITDLDAWHRIQSGEWRFVSPSIFAWDITEQGDITVLKDFAFDHVAFVPQGAYPNTQVLSTFAGQESSLRTFSAALTEELSKIASKEAPVPQRIETKPKGESWKMSENAQDEKAEDANAKVEIARLTAQVDKLTKENAALVERLENLEAARRKAKAEELLALKASLGITPSKEMLEKFQAMDESTLNMLIADARELAEHQSFSGVPKAKYSGDRQLSAEEKVRLRLLGHVDAPKEES